jgi:hypothetical protein
MQLGRLRFLPRCSTDVWCKGKQNIGVRKTGESEDTNVEGDREEKRDVDHGEE